MTEGQRPGHAVRTCLIGMRLGEVLGLPAPTRSSLFYALLMKDLGCSSNAARFAAIFGADDQRVKADLKTTNWTEALASFRFVSRNVAPGRFWLRRVWQLVGVLARGPAGARQVVVTRCERGARIARMLGFPDETAAAIRALDEHWDGGGQPYALSGEYIPLLARVLGVADICDALSATRPYREGLPPERVLEIMRRDVGTGVDPECFAALEATIQAAGTRAPEGQAPAACRVSALAEDYKQAA
jgi:hypothetical protein